MNPSKSFNRPKTFNPVVGCAILHPTDKTASPNLTRLRMFIAGDEDNVDLDVIRKQPRLGNPLGDIGFLEMLSRKLCY